MKKLSQSMDLQILLRTIALIAGLCILLASCNKDHDGHEHQEPNANPIERYKPNLPEQAVAELTAARNATARYHSIDSAIADGYADIEVVVQNMGFHYMKSALVDTLFNPAKPELLVYNKQHDGHVALVAVEYAVPIPLMPNKAPEGFTGPADVWTYSTQFNLWLLHAWVWEYNPLGVFVPNNPNVHLH